MKHTEIPLELDNKKANYSDPDNAERILKHGDKVIYAAIRRNMNESTRECYPSIRTIRALTGCGENKVLEAIQRLIQAGFIQVTKRPCPNGKISNWYYFPKSKFDKHFEMFTDAFLDMDLPLNVKEYYMDIQRFLLGKSDGKGKAYTLYSNNKIAELTGWTVPSVKKFNTILIEKGILTEEETSSKDNSGLPIIQKNFNLEALNQAMLWIKEVETRIVANQNKIETIEERLDGGEFVSREQYNKLLEKVEKLESLQRNKTNDVETFAF